MVDLPKITDEDIAWSCEVLGLPPNAFSGADGTDPRQAVLRNCASLDVEACPDSGKTTLLVAKLAILARHWKARDQGICVISHTNAARREIEKRLGITPEGLSLLSYPHYVGTIHGFVNEYLALPWLRSKGAKIKAIDDDLCLEWRWRMIPHGNRYAIEQRRKGRNVARYQDTQHTPKDFGFAANTPTYERVREACAASTEAGYYCHEEMFVWASDLLEADVNAIKSIRSRFPVLFIDEVQDNSELQARLLERLFVEGVSPVIRQRFGDQNQAIYDYGDDEGAVSDPFPAPAIAQTLPNSHRFGKSIADLANPLAVAPHGLIGQGGLGPNGEDELAGRHIMILFDDTDVELVLPAYAGLLRDTLGAEELMTGDFTAVAAVHTTEGADHVPRSVRHYWTDYDPGLARSDPQPRKMIQFVRAAQRLAEANGEASGAVDVFAKGLLKLARLMNAEADITIRRFKHRYVMELLGEDEASVNRYRNLVSEVVIHRHAPTQAEWEGKISTTLSALAMAMAMSGADVPPRDATSFLEWSEAVDKAEVGLESINVMRDVAQEPAITVRLGSIHSVKGETHTATLVLESYRNTHHLNALKRWLLGKKNGGRGQSAAVHKRLRLHYVAMTRPRRLLCMAMRSESFTTQEIETLKDRGWRVASVDTTGTIFI